MMAKGAGTAVFERHAQVSAASRTRPVASRSTGGAGGRGEQQLLQQFVVRTVQQNRDAVSREIKRVTGGRRWSFLSLSFSPSPSLSLSLSCISLSSLSLSLA